MLTRAGRWRIAATGVALASVLSMPVPRAQEPLAAGDPAAAYDRLLDENVRDGLVYYRTLKSSRGGLDAYVASLASVAPVAIDSAPLEEQVAFWLNAYNAYVLETVVDHYPITQRNADYPAGSIRQIPGAFDGLRHRAAGMLLTLDQIELTKIAAFRDPRLFLALGRGAVGSGRLRSEAYRAGTVNRQLAEIQAECVTRSQCFQIARATNRMRVSAIFSWRQREFAELYAAESPESFARRSPSERAVLAFVIPQLYDAERAFIGTNTFRVEYLPFDWSLNDLTGRH